MTLYQDKYRIESTRLKGWDYRTRGWYFVTICTQDHASIFGKVADGEVRLSSIGRIALSELETLHTHYQSIKVDTHIVMPNHVHAIIMIDGEHYFSPTAGAKLAFPRVRAFAPPKAGSLSAIVRSYKAGVTQQCHQMGVNRDIWQARFHDHLLRGDKVIIAVRDYIRNNPRELGNRQREPIPSN